MYHFHFCFLFGLCLFCFIYLGVLVLGAYLQLLEPLDLIPLSLCNDHLCPLLVFALKYILPNKSIVVPAFFWFPSAWNSFFHPFTFSWCPKSQSTYVVGSIWLGLIFSSLRPFCVFCLEKLTSLHVR